MPTPYKHRLSDIVPENRTAYCEHCKSRVLAGRNPLAPTGWYCRRPRPKTARHHLRQIDTTTGRAYCTNCEKVMAITPDPRKSHAGQYRCSAFVPAPLRTQPRNTRGKRTTNTIHGETAQIDRFIEGMQEERLKATDADRGMQPWDYPPDPDPSPWANRIGPIIRAGIVPALPSYWRIGFDMEHLTVTISRLEDRKSARDVHVRDGDLEGAIMEAYRSANLPLWFRP